MNRLAVSAALAVSSLALAAPPAVDPVALLERTLARSSVTFAGASATAAAYTVSWPASSSSLNLVFASEARTATEAGLVRSITLEAPLAASNRLASDLRAAVLRASDALNRACFARTPRALGAVIDAALQGRLNRIKLRPETRVSVDESRTLRLTFTLPLGATPKCAMPTPRR